MGSLRRGWTGLKYLLRRGRRKDEIVEELESYIEIAAEEKQAAGMPRRQALREARLELNGVESVREGIHDASLGAALETLWRDAHYALRNLRGHPAFSIAVIVTVALGISANAAIFSIVNAVLLRPVPAIAEPARLVEVSGGTAGNYVDLSYPTLTHFREQSETLDDLAVMLPSQMGLAGDAGPLVLNGFLVSGNYFSVLGLTPSVGRFFTADESHPTPSNVAVISHSLWQRRYREDPAILGRSVLVNGSNLEIVGVGPAGFRGQVPMFATDLWVPFGVVGSNFPEPAMLDDPGANSMSGIGRLARGVNATRAEAELNLLLADTTTPIQVDRYRPLPGMVRGPGTIFLGVLMGIVALVLAIACINVTNMLLSRGIDRGKEIAIRLAMGAGRGRVVRQLLIETLVLFGIAAIGGFLLSFWTTGLLVRALPPLPISLALDLSPDTRVLLFTLAVALIAGLISGLAPAFRATRPDLVPALKGELHGNTVRGTRGRRILLGAQVAATILLLICSGLFGRALTSAQSLDLGFEHRGVEVAQLNTELSGFTAEQQTDFRRRLLESIGATPGVKSAAISHKLPLGSKSGLGGIHVEGVADPGEWGWVIDHLLVAGDYHETVGIPLRKGRWIRESDDAAAPHVAVINETMANRMWPDGNAVGQRFWSGTPGTGTPYDVIGVIADSSYHGLIEETPNFAYMPLAQHEKPATASWGPTNVLLRVDGGGQGPGLASIQSLVHELDPTVPVLSVQPLKEHIARYWFPQQFAAWVTGVVGLLGLMLGAVGIYGVTAYTVSQRKHEISVRMALGARPVDVVRSVVGRGVTGPAIGALVGLAAAVALTRLLGRLLVNVSPLDPVTFGGVLLVLGSVVLLANWLPARRAARLSPAVVLKDGG